MTDIAETPAVTALTATRSAPERLVATPWFRNLFVAELWERFGFYGIQAILVLYAVAPVEQGGLGLPKGSAAALFGAFLGITFMMALPGGWFADRVLGQQRALVAGLAVIASGFFSIAVGGAGPTVVGLLLISCGFGLFKPNHQALVNMLAGPAGRREATIAAFFVGIQATAFVAPFVVGTIGERVSWRMAFATVGIVVAVGVAVTARSLHSFGDAGARRSRPLSVDETGSVRRRMAVLATVVLVLLAAGLGTGVLTAQVALIVVGLTLLAAPWGGYFKLRRNPALDDSDRRQLSIMLVLVLGATVFWLLAGQDGSVLTLFAKHATDRSVLGFTFPASWLQGATPFFMLVLAPLFAWQLPRLGARVDVPTKFAFGLLLAGVSFFVMAAASVAAADGAKVSPLWLLSVYLMHACGEIVIAAVSISSIADLVPRDFLGQALGLYWLFAALGGGLSSQVAALIDVVSGPVYYLSLGVVALAAGSVFLVFRSWLGAPFVTDDAGGR